MYTPFFIGPVNITVWFNRIGKDYCLTLMPISKLNIIRITLKKKVNFQLHSSKKLDLLKIKKLFIMHSVLFLSKSKNYHLPYQYRVVEGLQQDY